MLFRSLDIHGLPAAIATLPDAMTGVVYLDGQAYIIQCQSKSDNTFSASRNDMLDTIQSFHTLSAAERKQAKPLALKLITAHKGDTYARLARNSPLGKSAENYLRLINGNYPQGEPAPGQLVKTVE